MAKAVTPSDTIITEGQTVKFDDLLLAGLRKSGLPREAVQKVYAEQGEVLVAELIAVFRKRVEMIADIIVRIVPVNRARAPEKMLDATGRRQYVDKNVVKTMPRGAGNDAEMHFFKPRPEEYTRPGFMSDADLEKALDRRGLKAADPYSLAAVNEADPAFADERPNCTHWKNAAGKWCYATFRRWGGERGVDVDRDGYDWNGGWWFAGLRK